MFGEGFLAALPDPQYVTYKRKEKQTNKHYSSTLQTFEIRIYDTR